MRFRFVDALASVGSQTQMELSDERTWIAAAKGGEPEALARLYECYQRPVYSLCYRLLGNEDDA